MVVDPPHEWLSAEAIAGLFVVAPETLELYRVTGTLRSIQRPDGARMFDAIRVAQIFARRRPGRPAPRSARHLPARAAVLPAGAEAALLTAIP